MKIQKIKSDSKGVTRFIVDDTNAAFMNALRRACTFEVPVLAIEDVYFVKNSSALYDEILAHRLGLVPLKTDLKSYIMTENCKCKGEGCARCQVKITLKIAGPCMVRAKDFKIQDSAIKPIFPEMPIVELLEGHEIEFEAIATLGKGKEHAKWSAGHSYYQRYPKIIVGSGKKTKEGISYCPNNVFKGEKVAEIINCNICGSCQENSDNSIKVDGEDNKFIFTLEPWGQLNVTELLTNATKILSEKTKELKLK
jgi:DNA-directed RNA polymerase subunit D